MKLQHDIEECVKRLDLRPGDTAVLRFPSRVTGEFQHRIREQWALMLPEVKLVILTEGASLEVLSPPVKA